MAKNLMVKKELVEKVSGELGSDKDVNAFVVNYTSLSSVDMNTLKSAMFKADSRLTVIKNTLIKRVLEKSGVSIEKSLEGQNALLAPKGDIIAPLKVLFEYIKKNEKGSVVFGVLNGKVIASDQVKALSELPSRDVLIAKILGGFNAPITGFAHVLNGVQGNFVRVLSAIKDTKQ